jgi:hypothetical protein
MSDMPAHSEELAMMDVLDWISSQSIPLATVEETDRCTTGWRSLLHGDARVGPVGARAGHSSVMASTAAGEDGRCDYKARC